MLGRRLLPISAHCIFTRFTVLDSVRSTILIFDPRPASFALQSLTAHWNIGDKYIVPSAAHFSHYLLPTHIDQLCLHNRVPRQIAHISHAINTFSSLAKVPNAIAVVLMTDKHHMPHRSTPATINTFLCYAPVGFIGCTPSFQCACREKFSATLPKEKVPVELMANESHRLGLEIE